MNRKYILLRRILGISTILLGILIAVLPMFGRAAVSLRLITDDGTKLEHDFSATLENGKDDYGLFIYAGDDAFDKSVLSQLGTLLDKESLGIYFVDAEDYKVNGDFGDLSIVMSNPFKREFDKEQFKIYRLEADSELVPVQYNYENGNIKFDIPSSKVSNDFFAQGILYFVNQASDENIYSVTFYNDDYTIIMQQYCYRGNYADNPGINPKTGLKERDPDEWEFDHWTCYEGGVKRDDDAILNAQIYDDWECIASYRQKASGSPTATTTPTPSPTGWIGAATTTPTPRVTSTPTPTPITVRISDVQDLRTGDTSDKRGISGTVYGGSIPSTIMIVRDSDGVSIKKIVVQRKGMILKPWNIRFVDSVTKMDITGFNRLKITLPIPATMNLSRGRVLMVGRRRSGKLHVFDTKIVTNNGFKCVEFNTDYISDYEYGMLYIPDDGGDPEKNLIVADEREDKTDADLLAGCVSEGSGERRLHVADSDGVVILRRIVWRAGMSLKPYRIWVTDSEGKDATDFGVLSVTLPLPADMDPDKGEIRVVGSTAENAADDFVPEIFYTVDGKACIRFATDYISDKEYGIVYTPYTAEPEATATPTPAATGTPTPTLTPTPYANNTPTPTKQSSAPTPTTKDVSIVTPTPADTPTPDEQGGIVSGGGEDDGGGNDGGGNGGGGNGHPGSGPIVTPKGRSFTENGVNMNYATTGTGSGKISSGGVVKGGSVSNAKDMPKTGMADVPRMLIVIILIAVGSIELITTMPFIKKD